MSERYTIARITRDGEHFEILTKPQRALSYRLGKTSSVSEVLATDTIFFASVPGVPTKKVLLASTNITFLHN